MANSGELASVLQGVLQYAYKVVSESKLLVDNPRLSHRSTPAAGIEPSSLTSQPDTEVVKSSSEMSTS